MTTHESDRGHVRTQRTWSGLGALLVAASLLAGCGTAPYGEMNAFGGVTSSPDDATHRTIFAKGNSGTEMITLQNWIVRRAAEDTLKAGFSSFEIVSTSNETREAQYQTAATSSSGCGKKGCSSTYTPAGVMQVATPTITAKIAMSNSTRPSRRDASFFVAAEVLKEYKTAAK